MIKENLKEIIQFIDKALSDDMYFNKIQSLRIDKRKPYTDRLFFFLKSNPKLRVCLHTFQACNKSEAFAHPHSWESEVLLLEGKYEHWIENFVKLDMDISDSFNDGFCIGTILTSGSSYHIDNPHTWHKVQPLTECKTIMINGPVWEKHSQYCKFTKGKELIEISDTEKRNQLIDFYFLLLKQKI
jgi:hypothetical protein